MASSSLREVRAAVADVSRRSPDPVALERDVARVLQRRVPADLWCTLTMDPVTADATGGYHAEGLPLETMPRLLELESGDDVARLESLALGGATAVTLDRVTGGDPARSARYRDVLEPAGIRHELRAVFRGDAGTWGAVVLMRGDTGFTDVDVALLASVSETVAEGLRRASLLSIVPQPDDAPGLLLCGIGAAVTVDHCTDTARQWLDEIDDESDGALPFAVMALVHSAAAAGQPERRTRLRTRKGTWLTLHATRLGPSLVSVILEPARPRELAAMRLDALRLTSREQEVTALAVRGLTNAQIGAALYLSPHTVNDHLKSVFGKAGVTGRTELVSTLYVDPA